MTRLDAALAGLALLVAMIPLCAYSFADFLLRFLGGGR